MIFYMIVIYAFFDIWMLDANIADTSVLPTGLTSSCNLSVTSTDSYTTPNESSTTSSPSLDPSGNSTFPFSNLVNETENPSVLPQGLTASFNLSVTPTDSYTTPNKSSTTSSPSLDPSGNSTFPFSNLVNENENPSVLPTGLTSSFNLSVTPTDSYTTPNESSTTSSPSKHPSGNNTFPFSNLISETERNDIEYFLVSEKMDGNVTVPKLFASSKVYIANISNQASNITKLMVYQFNPNNNDTTIVTYHISKANQTHNMSIQKVVKTSKCFCNSCGRNMYCHTFGKCVKYYKEQDNRTYYSCANSDNILQINSTINATYCKGDYCNMETSIKSRLMSKTRHTINCLCNNCPGSFACFTYGSCYYDIINEPLSNSTNKSTIFQFGCVEKHSQDDFCSMNITTQTRHCCNTSFCNHRPSPTIQNYNRTCLCDNCGNNVHECVTDGQCITVSKKTSIIYRGCLNRKRALRGCKKDRDIEIKCCDDKDYCNNATANSTLPL